LSKHYLKNDEDPSYSSELANLPAWDRALWLSRAYLEASSCLCQNMLDGDFSSQYSSSRVILHLARQGIELFLKGAIEGAGHPTVQFGHNLDKLFLEYRRHYPEISFFFEVPSHFQVDLNADLFPESLIPFHATLDQRHRYATDKKGKSFATPEEIFDPVVTHAEIKELCRVLGIVEWCDLRPKLKGKIPIR
jgi:hypothetical protein